MFAGEYCCGNKITGIKISSNTSLIGVNLCNENEGLIWSYIVKNEDLNSLNPAIIQTYIGEGPFTQGFSQEHSPGNLGQWIGWQILKKFTGKNTGITPDEVMKTDVKKILDEAKYKPK